MPRAHSPRPSKCPPGRMGGSALTRSRLRIQAAGDDRTTFTVGGHWPSFGFDPARTGTNPDEVAVGVGEVNGLMPLWDPAPSDCTLPSCGPSVGARFTSSPAIQIGTVYIGVCRTGTSTPSTRRLAPDLRLAGPRRFGDVWRESLCGGLVTGHRRRHRVRGLRRSWSHAFDGSSGQLRAGWPVSVKAGCALGVTCPSVLASPTVTDGRVFIAASDGTIAAFDASTGAKVWRNKPAAGTTSSSSVAVAGGVAYGLRSSGTTASIWALDAAAGTKKWSVKFGSAGASSPSISGGLIPVGNQNGSLYEYDATTGRRKWLFSSGSGHSVVSSPATAIVGGTPAVFFASADASVPTTTNRLFAVNQTRLRFVEEPCHLVDRIVARRGERGGLPRRWRRADVRVRCRRVRWSLRVSGALGLSLGRRSVLLIACGRERACLRERTGRHAAGVRSSPMNGRRLSVIE